MASKVSVNVAKGVGQSFLRELAYAGIRAGVTVTRKGNNDSVEYDDTVVTDPNDVTIINNVIAAHDPKVVAPFSGEDDLEAHFIEDETGRLTRMSIANRKEEDLEELIITIQQLGPEGLADQFLLNQ